VLKTTFKRVVVLVDTLLSDAGYIPFANWATGAGQLFSFVRASRTPKETWNIPILIDYEN